jgi:hypothetical protein
MDKKMDWDDLINRLENLRVGDSDFFNISYGQSMRYEGKNEMLDDCLQVVYDYGLEHGLI